MPRVYALAQEDSVRRAREVMKMIINEKALENGGYTRNIKLDTIG